MASFTPTGPVLTVGDSTPPDSDPRRALLQRIAASVPFQKSNRLRELLLFVGEHSLSNGDVHLREHDIGVGVFGRPADYDTSQDTLVRVQVSQLRKKLQQFFEEEGREETLVVDLPKGSYALVFREREAAEVPAVSAVAVAAARPTRRWWVLGVMGGLVLLCGWLAVQNVGLRRRAEFGMGARPSVDALWKQLFGNGEHSYMIMADGNLVILEDAIRQDISLSDYQNKEFRRLAERKIEDPVIRSLVLNVAGRNHTSMADASVLRRFTLLFAGNGLPFDAINAREATINQVTGHSNSILMGSRRANPWVTLYEDRLNFQTVFEESPRVAYFVNRAPQAGEAGEYRGLWTHRGYCRVAFLSTAKGNGNVLLISGTDVPSTEAGGEFLASEAAVGQLRQAFGLGAGEPMPHFEVLLQTRLVNNTVAQFEVVAKRRN
jgi:hypothetical protein